MSLENKILFSALLSVFSMHHMRPFGSLRPPLYRGVFLSVCFLASSLCRFRKLVGSRAEFGKVSVVSFRG